MYESLVIKKTNKPSQKKIYISTRESYDDWRCYIKIEHKIVMHMYDLFLAEYDNNGHSNWFPIFISCMCQVHTSNYTVEKNE